MTRGTIRGFTPAAPLKRFPPGIEPGEGGAIRGFTPAAPLKRATPHDRAQQSESIRGFTPAAPLKLFPLQFFLRGQVFYPRVHTRGPIEASITCNGDKRYV